MKLYRYLRIMWYFVSYFTNLTFKYTKTVKLRLIHQKLIFFIQIRLKPKNQCFNLVRNDLEDPWSSLS